MDEDRAIEILVLKAIEIAKERRERTKEKLVDNIKNDSQLIEKEKKDMGNKD